MMDSEEPDLSKDGITQPNGDPTATKSNGESSTSENGHIKSENGGSVGGDLAEVEVTSRTSSSESSELVDSSSSASSSCFGTPLASLHSMSISGSGSIASSNGGNSVNSSFSGSGEGVGASGGQPRKRVQIVTELADDLPPYKIEQNLLCRVNFPFKTWDAMIQGCRIALNMNNVFICDHFLGHERAAAVIHELLRMRESRTFERHMRKVAGSPNYNYSCLFLVEPEESHKQLDALILMVYKLAQGFTKTWSKVSVELAYFPKGHKFQTFPKTEETGHLLKCMYFPNSTRTQQSEVLTINTPCRKTKVEPEFDRLVLFWGDMLEHTISESTTETFRLTVWLTK